MGQGLPQGPCQRPPWGRLTAVNAATGEFAWQITLGVTDGLPPEKQNTGRGGSAGPMVTAGGLVFIGTTADARFRAIDSKTGKELFVTRLNATGSATPMTYQGAQRQAIRRAGRRRHAERVRVALERSGRELFEHPLLPRGRRVDGVEREHVEAVDRVAGSSMIGASERRNASGPNDPADAMWPSRPVFFDR